MSENPHEGSDFQEYKEQCEVGNAQLLERLQAEVAAHEQNHRAMDVSRETLRAKLLVAKNALGAVICANSFGDAYALAREALAKLAEKE